MERSPQKWKTSYGDQFRKFRDSPQRGAQNDEVNPDENDQYENIPNFEQDMRGD